MDLYYRQAALQKPLPYRLFPPGLPLLPLTSAAATDPIRDALRSELTRPPPGAAAAAAAAAAAGLSDFRQENLDLMRVPEALRLPTSVALPSRSVELSDSIPVSKSEDLDPLEGKPPSSPPPALPLPLSPSPSENSPTDLRVRGSPELLANNSYRQ